MSDISRDVGSVRAWILNYDRWLRGRHIAQGSDDEYELGSVTHVVDAKLLLHQADLQTDAERPVVALTIKHPEHCTCDARPAP